MRIFHYIGLVFILLLVSGCGGGGGGGDGGSTPPPPVKPPPPPPPFFSGVELGSIYGSLGTIADITHDQPTLTSDVSDAEKDAFRNEAQYSGQAALEMIHASAAYARLKKASKGEPGNGITLGMIDDGVDHSIAEIKANIDDDSWLGVLLNAADITTIEASIGTIEASDIAFTLTGSQKQVNVITNQPSLTPQASCIRAVQDFILGHQFCLVALADGSYMLLRPADVGNNHGTSIASIMVGIKDDETDATAEPENDIYGLSYDAKLFVTSLLLTAFDGDRPDFSDSSIYAMDDRFLTQAVNNQLAKNPVAVNMSVLEIGNGDIFFTGDDAARTALITGIRSSFNGFITALAQASKPKAERVIFVLAAGNDGRDHPGYFAAMQSYITELEGHLLTVVAVNLNEAPNARDGLSDEELRRLLLRYGRQGEPGEIADFSNGCGIAKKWCLAAPGRGIYRIDAPAAHPAAEAFKEGQGTSFAAPLVTSALGLLKQWWPQLGNDELVLRLLKTANRTGVYANSDLYGWGLLDLDAATRPAGATSMQMGSTIGEQGVPSAQSFMEIAPPLAGLTAGFQGKTIALFDELDT
ncbi:MAG: S8 family peptidase, partial [Parvibaculales bacterium]